MYHPNSLKALEENRKNTQFCGESAVRAAKKKHEKEAFFKSINEDLRERLTPERIAELNERIISMAKNGNLKAYELIRNGLGEDPGKKVNLPGSGQVEYILSWGDGPESYQDVDCEQD